MDLIKWEEKYSVGVEEIDRQHQKLFKLLNHFIETLGGENPRDEVRKVLEEMIDYIDYHFNTEEAYFKKHPEFEKHRSEHVAFVKKALALQSDFIERGEGVSQDVLKFLITWLKNHILGTDIKYFGDMRKMTL